MQAALIFGMEDWSCFLHLYIEVSASAADFIFYGGNDYVQDV